MAENGEHNGLAAQTYTGLGRVTSTEFVWTEDDEESLRVLKLAGAFGILMLLAYLAYDQFVWGRNGAGTALHWLTLAATCLFFGLSWTSPFRRHWKLWVLLYNLFLIAIVHPNQSRNRQPRIAFYHDHVVPTGDRRIRQLGHALAGRDGCHGDNRLCGR